MLTWIPDLLLFCAGVSGGVLIMMLMPYLAAGKRKRTELVAARSRILAGFKEKHDEEILDEAFRATEAIKGELDKSLTTLQRALNAVVNQGGDAPSDQRKQILQLSDTVKPT
jgi:hypothetical protein